MKIFILLYLFFLQPSIALNEPFASPIAISTYLKVRLHKLSSLTKQEQWEGLQILKKELRAFEKDIVNGKINANTDTQKTFVSWMVDIEQLNFRSPSEINKSKCQAIHGDFAFGTLSMKTKDEIPESSQWVLDTLAKICQMPELSYSYSSKTMNYSADSDDEAIANMKSAK